MTVPVLAFFNNKGGVGKTTLVLHISWMMADMGHRVVAVDLDPQGNLSAGFLDGDRLEELWPENQSSLTVFGALRPLQRGIGDIADPHLEYIEENLCLLPGDMALSTFEDQLAEAWPKCLDRDERAFRVMSAFWRIMQKAAHAHDASLVLLDLGPNLGAINRAALIASDFVVIPLCPDLYSLQGLRNLGPRLRAWRSDWRERRQRNPASDLELPLGNIDPLGYIVLQHSVRLDRPVKSYDKWIAKIPYFYKNYVLDLSNNTQSSVGEDQNCIALVKHYRSLMPIAQEARKPIFHLKPADGALGAHTYAVRDAYRDFKGITQEILRRLQNRHVSVAETAD